MECNIGPFASDSRNSLARATSVGTIADAIGDEKAAQWAVKDHGI